MSLCIWRMILSDGSNRSVSTYTWTDGLIMLVRTRLSGNALVSSLPHPQWVTPAERPWTTWCSTYSIWTSAKDFSIKHPLQLMSGYCVDYTRSKQRQEEILNPCSLPPTLCFSSMVGHILGSEQKRWSKISHSFIFWFCNTVSLSGLFIWICLFVPLWNTRFMPEMELNLLPNACILLSQKCLLQMSNLYVNV